MKKPYLVLAVIVLALLLLVNEYFFGYPEPPVDPAWQVAPAEVIPDGAVTVRFSGTSTLLFSDGDTKWMIDGWFSRPGPVQILGATIAPDLNAIELGLARNEVTELAAVIPVHSHYDHAMDSPEVAQRTGAMLIGSEATANIARGWGLAEEQIQVVSDGESVALGDFNVTFIESRHFQFPDPQMVETMLTQSEIPEPLVPPAAITDYKVGKAYVLHVQHPKGQFMVVGSAGFIPGQLDAYDVDTLFLGVGGLGSQTVNYRDQYWHHTVDAVQPERIVLIHWDSLTGLLDGPMVGEIRIAGFLASGAGDTLSYLKSREAQSGGVPLQTLPRFEPVVLYP